MWLFRRKPKLPYDARSSNLKAHLSVISRAKAALPAPSGFDSNDWWTAAKRQMYCCRAIADMAPEQQKKIIFFVGCVLGTFGVLSLSWLQKIRSRDPRSDPVRYLSETAYQNRPMSFQFLVDSGARCPHTKAPSYAGFLLRNRDKMFEHPELFLRCIKFVLQMVRVIDEETIYLVTSCEYSPGHQVLWGFCSEIGVQVINVQHGVKNRECIDAFALFHLFICWDPVYVRVLQDKGTSAKFFVSLPDRFSWMRNSALAARVPVRKIAYVLQGFEDRQAIEEINRHLKALCEKQSREITVFSHPIYTSAVPQQFIEFDLQKGINLEEEIHNFDTFISVSSTVLYEVFLWSRQNRCQKTLIINDLFGDRRLTDWPVTMKPKMLSEVSSTAKIK